MCVMRKVAYVQNCSIARQIFTVLCKEQIMPVFATSVGYQILQAYGFLHRN